jgi:hypothetical protein
VSVARRVLALSCAALAACICAPGAAAAPAGALSLSSDPPMFPAFTGGVPDYAVRCKGKAPVKLTFDAQGATQVSINGGAARGGHFTASVSLGAGHALRFKVDAGPDAGSYHLRCIPADFPHWSAERTGSPQARWYVVTPIRLGYKRPGFTILFDRNGTPVWWMRDAKGSPFTGTLLSDGGIAWFPYQGTPFAIDKEKFEEHALDGHLMRTFSTVKTLTDHHELQVLPNHHAVMDSYVPRDHVDLRAQNPSLPSDATVVDGQIQEVDRHGKVKWSWSTKGHIGLDEASRWWRANPVRLRDRRVAYDIVHLNSVDVHGNLVVISTRHTDAVFAIDKSTGKILWKLGGTNKPYSLAFMGDPFGTQSFGGNHDARISDDGTLLTLFDNGTGRNRPPRAVQYRIDRLTKTATLLNSITDPGVPGSLCCGSARLLPGGDWVVSWGGNFIVTEAAPDGQRRFALSFSGERQSYRAIPILPSQLTAGQLRSGMDTQAK